MAVFCSPYAFVFFRPDRGRVFAMIVSKWCMCCAASLGGLRRHQSRKPNASACNVDGCSARAFSFPGSFSPVKPCHGMFLRDGALFPRRISLHLMRAIILRGEIFEYGRTLVL